MANSEDSKMKASLYVAYRLLSRAKKDLTSTDDAVCDRALSDISAVEELLLDIWANLPEGS